MKNLIIRATVTALAVVTWSAWAGPLEPPANAVDGFGDPVPTKPRMGPRKPIYKSDLPLTITQSDSYYLAEDITGAPGGIIIDADGVTIDGMGFSLQGTGPGSGDGICVTPGTKKNLTITDISVGNWDNGISLEDTKNSRVTRVYARGNDLIGVHVGKSAMVENVTAELNGSHGIGFGAQSSVKDCISENNGGDGFNGMSVETAVESVVTGSTSTGNSGEGFNLAAATTVTWSKSSRNALRGFRLRTGSKISDSNATENTGHEIQAASKCVVERNFVDGKGTLGHGILITAAGSRVSFNESVDNECGIKTEAPGSRVTANSARDNLIDFDLIAGTDFGAIRQASDSASVMSATVNMESVP